MAIQNTIEYTITNGPGKYDLMMGVFEKKIIFFKATDKFGTRHLFKVCADKIKFLEADGRCVWDLSGLIVEKDGRNIDDEKFTARFDSKKHSGSFRELPEVAQYSSEYFDSLSDEQLKQEIVRFKRDISDGVKELDQYSLTLPNRHDRLLLEAMHLWELCHATVGVKIGHELHTRLKAAKMARV
jgi:hypothetical protein